MTENYLLQRASDATGYDYGDDFNSPDEVRMYMQIHELGQMADNCGAADFTARTDLTQEDLDTMAEEIIRTRSHCNFRTCRGPFRPPNSLTHGGYYDCQSKA
jgi:hypothetical protein